MKKSSYFRQGISLALQRQVGKRSYIPTPRNYALVSYPKSGNTWLRGIIANILVMKDLQMKEVELVVPDIYKRSVRWLEKNEYTFFKSHEVYHPAYSQVVYLVRDPRDVAVSYYNYQIKTGQIGTRVTIEQYVEQFVHRGCSSYGRWSNHVMGWVPLLGSENFKLLKYEDLTRDPCKEVNEILFFAGISSSDEDVAWSVEKNSIDKMRVKAIGWEEKMASGSPQDFFQRAKGGEESRLPVQCKEMIEYHFESAMKTVGYL